MLNLPQIRRSQFFVIEDLPSHSAPPCFAGDLDLLLVCVPWPQVTEQELQVPHPFHRQSTAANVVKWRRIPNHLTRKLTGDATVTRFDFKNLKTQGDLPKNNKLLKFEWWHTIPVPWGWKFQMIDRFLSLRGLFSDSILQIFGDFYRKL